MSERCLWIGVSEDFAPAFTDDGIENLRELVWIYKNDAKRRSADQAEKA